MTIAGYMSMMAKDTLKGYWPPRDPGDPRTWVAAAQQGGAWGTYGAFLFSSTNRFGGSTLETIAGPAIGSAADLLTIGLEARDYAVSGGEDPLSKGAAISTIVSNTPYANLFYVKPAVDYLFLNSLREMASPGYLRRQERNRQRNYGQTKLIPSEVAP